MANQRLKEEIKTLEDLRILLNDRVEGLTKQVKQQESAIHKMQETIDQNDGILEKLRSTVEKDFVKIKSLEAENKGLKEEGSKKDQLIEKMLKEAEDNRSLMDEAIGEIVEKSDQIYLEYKKALANFRAEPKPLPQDLEGGAKSLLNWILNEYSSLVDILNMASDNSAVISWENILTIFDHEGCEHLSLLSSSDYVFPAYSDLDQNISSIQSVKKAFVWRFWKVAH
jgi:hypothetical protein